MPLNRTKFRFVSTACGGKRCSEFEMCDNDQCVCPEMCTEQYEPVCAKNMRNSAIREFPNECYMMREICQAKEKYVKLNDGRCSSK